MTTLVQSGSRYDLWAGKFEYLHAPRPPKQRLLFPLTLALQLLSYSTTPGINLYLPLSQCLLRRHYYLCHFSNVSQGDLLIWLATLHHLSRSNIVLHIASILILTGEVITSLVMMVVWREERRVEEVLIASSGKAKHQQAHCRSYLFHDCVKISTQELAKEFTSR